MTTEKEASASQKDNDVIEASTESQFVSEEVYAEGVGSFTRVSCGEVYAFSSIATSNDLSEPTTNFNGVTQYGVEITFPNDNTELLVFQLGNLLRISPEKRRPLVTELFNEGTLWVSQFDDLFKSGMFPKTWDCLVVPTREDAEAIHKYREDSLVSYSPNGKFTVLMLLYSLSGAIVPSVFGVAFLISSAPLLLVLTILSFIVIYFGYDSVENYIDSKTNFEMPHFWGQSMNFESDSLADITPISDEFKMRTEKVLTGFTGKWTQGTINEVTETKSTTEISFLAKEGEELSLTFTTPADNSSRFTLNKLVDELGVGSVQMLKGESIEVGVPRINNDSEQVTKKDGFRVRVPQ